MSNVPEEVVLHLRQRVEKGEIDVQEAEKLAAQWQHSHEETSHQQFFENRGEGPQSVLLVAEDDEEAHARAKQAGRRVQVIKKTVEDALVNRVQDPSGTGVMQVTFEEFTRMMADPEFKKFSTYGANLLYYSDEHGNPTNRVRPIPIRPLLQNEVGVWRDRIVCLRDQGPGDLGTLVLPVGVDLTPKPAEPVVAEPSSTEPVKEGD